MLDSRATFEPSILNKHSTAESGTIRVVNTRRVAIHDLNTHTQPTSIKTLITNIICNLLKDIDRFIAPCFTGTHHHQACNFLSSLSEFPLGVLQIVPSFPSLRDQTKLQVKPRAIAKHAHPMHIATKAPMLERDAQKAHK